MGLRQISRTSREVSIQECLLDQWDQRYLQVSTGRFEGVVTELDLGDVRLAREQMNLAVAQQATPPNGWVALSLPVNGSRLMQFDYKRDEDREVLVMTDKGRYRAISDQNSDIMVIMIRRDRFERDLERFRIAIGDNTRIFVEVNAETAHDLMQIWAARDRKAGPNPALAPHHADLVIDKLASCSILLPDHVERDTSWRIDRRKVVRAACEAAEAAEHGRANLGLMCDAAQVNLRILQLAFQEVAGISPGRWLRIMRLNTARRRLLRETAISITEIATELGFFHLGRFAQEYGNLFHEPPSATRLWAMSPR